MTCSPVGLRRSFAGTDAGFSLVEVLIAIGVLTAVSLGVAQLFALATTTNLTAKGQTSASILAAQKMEQLRGLTWGFDQDPAALGLPVSDTTTDLSVDPPAAAGTGLNPSPAGSLESNVPGFVDFLDAFGNWTGNGATPPPTAVYVRRWSIEPLPTNPNNTLVFQVMVTTIRRESLWAAQGQGARGRRPDDAWLVSVKTRKAS
jgi:prepilin-type N-terminal cleavage/methylation domain-containing protein